MSKPAYIRCPNPKCGKSTPVQPGKETREHTCIFCGGIIPPKTVKTETLPAKKKEVSQFARQKSESKPVSKNMRKPMF